MDHSVSARSNAINMEVKKDGLSQRQNGDWQLRFTVAAIDMDSRVTAAAMGTRFQCKLVELADDEAPREPVTEIRNKWRALGPTMQAGIRCSDPMFWAFLREEKKFADVNDHERAAQIVRAHCCVLSRSDLNKPGHQKSRVLWHGLDMQFQAWEAKERHGG